MDERAAKLVKRLSPAGKIFLKRLNKALDEEIAAMNSAGGDAIRDEIARHHMRTPESIQSINRLAASHRKTRLTAVIMMMNYAHLLLTTGIHHRHRGELTPTGEQILQIWRIYANRLVDADEAPRAEIDAEEAALMQGIKRAGRGNAGGALAMLKKIISFPHKSASRS